MKKTENLKRNDSCIKLFTFLKMLYTDDVELKTVIDLLSEGDYDGTSNTHVTLNKYLNAMKIFGIKVKKIQNKYHLITPMSNIELNIEDIKSINTLKEAAKLLPEGNNKQNINTFLRALELRYDETAQTLAEISTSIKSSALEFANSKVNEQLRLCEQYCQDKLKLEIVYITKFGKERNIICSPLETIFVKKQLCLKVIGNSGCRIYDIPCENIKSIRQLHSSASKTALTTTIAFRIKDRLALNYKLRDYEKVQDIEPDGSKIIINKEEDLDELLSRLMKYGTECEIISPKFLREEMIALINKTLSNYK